MNEIVSTVQVDRQCTVCEHQKCEKGEKDRRRKREEVGGKEKGRKGGRIERMQRERRGREEGLGGRGPNEIGRESSTAYINNLPLPYCMEGEERK